MRTSRNRRTRSLKIESLELRALLSVQGAMLSTFGDLKLDPGSYDPSRILVRYREDLAEGAAGDRNLPAGTPLGLVPGLREVPVEPGQDYAAVLKAYQSDPHVLYAQPDYLLRINLAPNDPSFTSGRLWGLNNGNDADIDAPEAWSFNTGSGNMVVAVIDTGVDYGHPDLARNMWVNRDEVPGNNLDDDGNGFVDDVYGYDFRNNDGNPMDDNGHGTHVAGTIGAVGNNGVGVVGVNWNVKIMALKFLGADGSGSSSGAIQALNYAVQMGAKISNNSYGGDGYEQAFADALAAASNAGHIFVAAAGNDGRDIDTTPTYPGSYNAPNVVTVAATDSNDGRAWFSNFGARTVELGAPGVNIYSTAPGNRYQALSGTSMATPHVAGALALIWDHFPEMTSSQVINRMMGAVDPVASMATTTVSGGRLNVRRALDDVSPTADIVDVTPDPRANAVDSITIRFSEPVLGLDLSDLRLSRDGGANLLTSQQTLTSSDGGATYTLGNLSGLTGAAGTYTLGLAAAGSGIRDDSNNPLAGNAVDTWVVLPPSTGAVDFSGLTIQSYGGGQDVAGTAAVEDAGATLHLSGNTWKKVALPYAVTANTVLEFDFRSPARGEVHAIGLDTDDALSSDRGFRLYGTQADYGIAAFANYDASAPGWVSYRIPVGQYFTGAMQYLTFANDHDVAGPTAQSYFRNVRLSESTPPPSTGAVDFSGLTIQSYGGGQDVAGTAAVEDAGATLHLSGNTWKKVALPYAVTANTVLEFDFRSPARGEVHAIGLDTDDALSSDRGFRLYGTQADYGIAAFANYDASAPGWVSYRIPVGQYFTGAMQYLTFANDHDVAGPTAQSYFRNVRLSESTPPPSTGAVDFSGLTIQSYGGGQDVAGTAAVEDAGATLHLSGNTWKKVALPYAVTANTVLEFDFRSPARGEVHAIGLDTDDALSSDRGFRLYGTQTDYGIAAFANYDASAPGWVSYRIPVGQYFTGAMQYLTFANDHDVAGPTAQSYFRNVRLYEGTSTSQATSLAMEGGASAAPVVSASTQPLPQGVGAITTDASSPRLAAMTAGGTARTSGASRTLSATAPLVDASTLRALRDPLSVSQGRWTRRVLRDEPRRKS
ncbi:MAG: S8 family serine peptidase [Isosphaeraceae bacterium]